MKDRSAGTAGGPLKERAYGKLNLTLDVLGKRPDGYHDLRMVMCSVALCDELTIALGTGQDACNVQTAGGQPCGGVPDGNDNLALKAARAYADAAGVELGGVTIGIVKRIPAQAGMAGGSSDAAAVLRALNRRFGAFSGAELQAVGLRVGSDVPYCIFGGVALAEGRGERLTHLPDLPRDLCAVLLKPEFSVSTPALFRALDEAGRERSAPADGGTDAMLAALRLQDARAIGAALSNDFAPVLARRHPAVERCKRALLEHGALGSELTGTGSVVFGLFAEEETARRAAAALAETTPLALAVNVI